MPSASQSKQSESVDVSNIRQFNAQSTESLFKSDEMWSGGNCNKQYASFLLLNIQSMNPSASSSARWKCHELEALLIEESDKNHFIPFLALTETWLSPHIQDAQVHIKQYTTSRSDRVGRVGGGVLLYTHESIPITL